ncbi:PepSY domain-containing protein [Hyphomicrobium methylovorum]|uniref:PepSY domain-containing protein n=1 Tax=Hyphomicrobium methylovorum TaxID=84 RepID=UPI0015E72570|nr:PepSY domain-containing protein [Hyphomicrobium methylovorum]MBA2125644.1 PepSY domain-containing protein [Hyphomicrobium methylovorum]
MRRMMTAAALTLAMGFAAGNALADKDRPPTAEETSAISSALTSAGYKSWGKVELDDGKWEVDDAIAADGKKYDVDLSTDYKIIKQKLDND